MVKILVVDDSTLSRRAVRNLVAELGYEVEEASNGEQALERFALWAPDAVILDFVMTGMFGNEVLTKILQLNPAAKVIIVTADVQKQTAAEMRGLGAKALLHKPVARTRFLPTLQAVLAGEDLWNSAPAPV